MKRLRFTFGIVTLILFFLLVFGAELHYMALENVLFSTKLLIFVLLNLTLIALLVLVFFVGKNLVKVYLERKNRVLGYKFKTKFVIILVVLTMIPSIFLFIVSSGVITNYLDRWFDPQIRQPLNLSVEIAKAAYETERQSALSYAKAVASNRPVPENFTARHVTVLPEDASETMKAGFEGKADVEVITSSQGDMLRAVVPKYQGGRQAGVIIVETSVSKDISRNAEAINEAYRNYLTLESWKTPIKANYLLILGFFTLMTVFMALWVALRIARGITDPIQTLAQATEQVAKGNLDTNIDIHREDEIGLLVISFNNMVRELKENKESLHRTLTESDRRRLIIENILENVNSGVIFLDAAGNILTVNGAACAILDISPADILNRNYSVLLSMLKSEELKETVKNIRVKEFRGLEKEVRVTAGDRRVLLRIFITTIGDPQNFMGTLVVFDDLTEIVRAQKALAWEEVARRIAHEIKNPLTPIKLSTDHMMKKWQNGDEDFGQVFERSTKTIIKEVESLKRLVNEFSRFGKMPEINKTPCYMSHILEGVVNLYTDYKGLEIASSKQDDEPLVEVDAEQFKRVIINIVENAIQAMHGKGTIHISLYHNSAENRVYIDIADNGPGIREEDKEKLFLPYFSTKKYGTGLGLAIASRVVTEHRGYIRIKDNKPSGSIFTIELPMREG
ncbi:MAG: HAMP domain-containing protein [Nitrospirae bacterium]|nr:HAMP domain-containing protein [Nitrospirota bacterium]